jgi:hypothetical protein
MTTQSRFLRPEGEEGDYVYVQQGIVFINSNGRRSRLETIARALRLAHRPPDFICVWAPRFYLPGRDQHLKVDASGGMGGLPEGGP